jgi:signal transduction histidine kinase
MLGFVEAVADGSLPPEKQKYYLSLVAEEIKRLSRLVADLLDVSRLEMGERKMNFAKYDLADNAATVLISLEQRINDKKLDVSFEADEDKLFVSADADAMYRVLYNLIENAVKFSREGGKLSVTLTHTDAHVQLSVYNEGIGISKEDLPNIFDRFYKSDKSRGVDKKGVGLGLYFVKTIVNAHGGEIRAESREGIDSHFIMTLPLYAEKD